MKKIFIAVIFCLIVLFSQLSPGESINEVDDQYNKQYDALKPSSTSSSVRTDYIFERIDLSTMQSAKVLRLIYEQNQEMLARYEDTLKKYDEIIRQNNEIIKLLSKGDSKGEDKK
jgi:hypothetical protein